MTGDNYGIQHSGSGDVINYGAQAFGPHAHVSGPPVPPVTTRAAGDRTRDERTATRTGSTPTVFVSYAHDSPQHRHAVLLLAELLTANGIHVEIDQWAGVRRQDWGAWATEHIRLADFVIVVASPDYHRVADGFVATTANRGTQSEAAVLRDQLHGNRAAWVPKLLPVVLPGHDVAEIPMFLQPYSVDHYIVTELTDGGITGLLRVLTGQPNRVRPVLGALPDLPPRPAALTEPDQA
jgi:hypothetical protein